MFTPRMAYVLCQGLTLFQRLLNYIDLPCLDLVSSEKVAILFPEPDANAYNSTESKSNKSELQRSSLL